MTWWDAQAKALYEIIEQIALDLIASGAWAEADATWTTAVRTAENARRAVYNAADGIYLAIVACNTQRQAGASGHYAKGIAIYLSTAWAANQPSGTVYCTYFPFEGKSSTGVNADLATLSLTTWLFTDAVGGTGFAFYFVPAANATDNYQSNMVCVFERNASYLYAASGLPYYLWTYGNYLTYMANDAATASSGNLLGQALIWYSLLRPFVTQARVYIPFGDVTLDGSMEMGNVTLQGLAAFKSISDGKCYFMKPLISDAALYPSGYAFFNGPVLEAEFFFYVDSVKATLAHNDVVAMAAPATKQYQVIIQTSPDFATSFPMAMVKQL